MRDAVGADGAERIGGKVAKLRPIHHIVAAERRHVDAGRGGKLPYGAALLGFADPAQRHIKRLEDLGFFAGRPAEEVEALAADFHRDAVGRGDRLLQHEPPQLACPLRKIRRHENRVWAIVAAEYRGGMSGIVAIAVVEREGRKGLAAAAADTPRRLVEIDEVEAGAGDAVDGLVEETGGYFEVVVGREI